MGSGGREDALAWRLRQSPSCDKLTAAPGNPGIARWADCVALDPCDPGAVVGLARSASADLVVIGPESWGELHLATVAEEAGVPPTRVRAIEPRDAAQLAAVLSGAVAFVAPSRDEGDGTSIIEAMSLGVPVVHSDTPAYQEVAADAGISVPVGVGGGDGYVERLAAAVTAVVEHRDVADRLAVAGSDRARAFSWRDSAERVWQLHADL